MSAAGTQAMRLVYADPGLKDELGHHANSCRSIRDAFLARDIHVESFAFHGISAPLAEEFSAHRHFQYFTYWNTDGDPISGWLTAFHVAAEATERDLRNISGMQPTDLLYVNSARPAQFLAVLNWLRNSDGQHPSVVVEFGDDPGVSMANGPDGGITGVQDPKAILWRHAARLFPSRGIARFNMVTFDPAVSRTYSALLGRTVGVLPTPQGTGRAPANRTGKRPVTVAVLGHQRPDKGYHLMPDVARILLDTVPELRLLVHNALPSYMPDAQQGMRALAAADSRVVLDERVAGPEIWQDLLDQSDLLLCPYDPGRYAAAYSAVATEAVANAIPLVVPAHTTLAQVVADHGGAGRTFAAQQPQAIAEAVRLALREYDGLAERAFVAAQRWTASMGAANTVNEMLAMVGN